MGAMGATIYPARHPDLYCNTMLLAESGVLDTTTFWVDNQAAVLASGLEVALVVGERDTRAVNATTVMEQTLTDLNIPTSCTLSPTFPTTLASSTTKLASGRCSSTPAAGRNNGEW